MKMQPTLERLLAQTAMLLRRHGAAVPPPWVAAAPSAPSATSAASAAARTAQPPSPAPHGTFSAGHFTHRFGSRDYKLFVPHDGGGDALRPLLLMLHGCTQTPDDFAAGTRMNEAAANAGWAVLYPAQSTQANPQRCWNWFKHNHQQRDRGEAALLADLTRKVIAAHAIDPARVYVAGLSAGGAMAAVLGQAYADVFAAVGMHSGLPTGAAHDLPSALAAMRTGPAAGAPRQQAMTPAIVIHGDRDGTVHPANAEHAIGAFAAVASRETLHLPSAHGVPCTRVVLRDGSGAIVAEHWTVHGLGHAWSGGSAAGSYTMPAGPNATQAMLDFFSGQRLRTAFDRRAAA
jgi:poly(hydroxyalkanoate) depolymerase family esterase